MCETCRYFWVTDHDANRHVGRCHRYPPQHIAATTIPVTPDEWRWPKVTAGGYCGEHSPREGLQK